MYAPTARVGRTRRYLLTSFTMLAGALLLAGCASASAPTATGTSAPAATSPTSSSAASSSPAASTGAASSPVAAQAAATAVQAASTAAPAVSPVVSAASTVVAQASPAAAQAATAIRKVNPNTASIPDIQAALESAGVPNAARWAREVDEYKPYPADDPSFAKLRQNLAKYNSAPDVVEKIVSALTLS